MTSADRLHSSQVLSTRGSILSFSWCFTEVASIILGFLSSKSYPCFRFFRRQNKIMFTMIDSRRQAIKGIMIVQLSSETEQITLVRPHVWMVFMHVLCGRPPFKNSGLVQPQITANALRCSRECKFITCTPSRTDWKACENTVWKDWYFPFSFFQMIFTCLSRIYESRCGIGVKPYEEC